MAFPTGRVRASVELLTEIENAKLVVADRAVGCVERVHDHRVVWASEAHAPVAVAGDPGELGHRVLRVLPDGPGQSLGERGVFAVSIEDHPGGRDAGGVHRVCVFYFGQKPQWNHVAAFLCILGAVAFTFLPGK